MKCQILTRGLIPGIMIRGPVANIELAFDTICELLDRGVDVRREDGNPFDRIPLEEHPKKEMVITVPVEKKFKLPEPPELKLVGHPDPAGAPGTPGTPGVPDPATSQATIRDPKEKDVFGIADGTSVYKHVPYMSDGKTVLTGSENPDPEVQAMVHASAETIMGKATPGMPDPAMSQATITIEGLKEKEAEVTGHVVHEIVKHSADVLAEQQKAAYAAESADASPDDLESEDDDETPAPANTDSTNPYAGMSKNQAKKARRAAAKAAAEAAAKSGNSTPQ